MTAIAAHYKTGSTAPPFTYTLRDSSGDPIDVSGTATVTLHLDDPDGNTVLAGAAVTVEDGAAGEVSYSWAAGDLSTAGDHEAEFEITTEAGETRFVPPDRNIIIRVSDGPSTTA